MQSRTSAQRRPVHVCAHGDRAASREVAPEGVGQGPTHLAVLVRRGGCGAGLDVPDPYSPAFGMWSNALSSAGVLVAACCPLSVPFHVPGFNRCDPHTRDQECVHTLIVHRPPVFKALHREYSMPLLATCSIFHSLFLSFDPPPALPFLPATQTN
ncbi:hypothetical protein B0H13DRAFT_2309309 [Mycena leptocephala]|nr:hypothetical protein B0H13DRAFT_2309309 [Mycena leptocephala]